LASCPALDLQYGPAPNAGTLQDLLYAELDAFEPLAIHHDDNNCWRVFFRTGAHRDAALTALVAAFGDRLIDVSPVEVDDEDWARRSQADLRAVRVGRIVVCPPWDVPTRGRRDAGFGIRDPEPGPDRDPNPESRVLEDLVIVIEPSMGFGTGHHETTRLCLALLQAIDVRRTRVIDVGTGSGVLAIAAWMLGAAPVTALDNDPDALQSARENIARNGASGAIGVIEAALQSVAAPYPADIVLANLTGSVLQRHAGVLRGMVARGGTLVVSGFSPGELRGVVRAFGAKARATAREDDWAAAVIDL
jgi:ribosomal protein L11 methyltransferase